MGALALTACNVEHGSLGTGFQILFTDAAGCGDATVFARDPDDTLGLVFAADGPVAAAIEAGGTPTTEEFDAAEQGGLVVRTGVAVTSDVCGPGEPVLDETWRPIAGLGILTVTPNLGLDDLPRVDLELREVVFRDDASGDLANVSSLLLDDVAVGAPPE